MRLLSCILPLLVIISCTCANGVIRKYDFNVEAAWIAPDGFWREAYTINGQTPGPLISAEEGDTIRVNVVNNLDVAITFHWHGLYQKETPWMDGVPGVSQWPVLPKDQFTYEFKVTSQYGSFWYHSHMIGTYDDGIRGAIVVHPKADHHRPWSHIHKDASLMQSMEEALRKALNMQVFGWAHETARAHLVRIKSTGRPPICFDSVLLNGFGRVHCPKQEYIETANGTESPFFVPFTEIDAKGCLILGPPPNGTQGLPMISAGMPPALNGTQGIPTVPAGMPPPPSLEVVMRDNPTRCEETRTPYPVWKTSSYSSVDGRYMVMHLINMGTDVSYSVSIDGHAMYAFLVDGQFVKPQLIHAANVKVGSRVSVLIPLNQKAGDYVIRVAASDARQLQVISGYGVLRVDTSAAIPASRNHTSTLQQSTQTQFQPNISRTESPPLTADQILALLQPQAKTQPITQTQVQEKGQGQEQGQPTQQIKPITLQPLPNISSNQAITRREIQSRIESSRNEARAAHLLIRRPYESVKRQMANTSLITNPNSVARNSSKEIQSPSLNTSNTTQLIESYDDVPDTFIDHLPITKAKQWMMYDGRMKNDTKLTVDQQYKPLSAKKPPQGPADLTIKAEIMGQPMSWRITDKPYKSLHSFQEPLLFRGSKADLSEYEGTVFDAKIGDVVDLIFYTQGVIGHPMHKHHSHFWVIGQGSLTNGTLPWNSVEEGLTQVPHQFNLDDPPFRDTALFEVGTWIALRFVVEFPSATLIHCHVQHHIASGQAIVIREGIDQFDELARRIPDAIQHAPHVPHVRTNISSPVGLDAI